MKWINIKDELPPLEQSVLCFHDFSRNHFVCHRVKDCQTGELKWFGNAMPTHWQPLTSPLNTDDKTDSYLSEKYQELFDYMLKEFAVILTQTDMDEIVRLSAKIIAE